jgi:hypothetical protein
VEALVEISSIDLRYEHCRMRHAGGERRLLAQIAEGGIREPLLGMANSGRHVLLDGFKRWRCAQRLGIPSVPFRSLGADEAMAIIVLMRRANALSLTIVEQACLIDELRKIHALSVADIAKRLERSPAWVSVRCGVLDEMPPTVREQVMRGDFPIYSYMYHVRQFMRISKAEPAEAAAFVAATGGKGLSQREIGALAGAYFKGGDDVRSEIIAGNLGFCLEALRRTDAAASGCTVAEERVIADLDLVGRRMRRLEYALKNETLTTPAFFAQVHLLSGGILRLATTFTERIRGLYDRSRPAPGHRQAERARDGDTPDCSPPGP